jgi:thymidylate synthase (FAD)
MLKFNPTPRPSSDYLDSILGVSHPVLDHGFVRCIDYMGGDAAIVQAARVSYGAGTKHVSEDKSLIRYLLRNKHNSPLEMCEIKYHIKLPIFIARQFIRHRTANVNEYSGRYSVMDSDYYTPASDRLCTQGNLNKQGSGIPLDDSSTEYRIQELREHSDKSFQVYTSLLGGENNPIEGISRELARMVLPVNYYTQWYWKIDLRNLLMFLHLRLDDHAQYEIRAYAEVMASMVQQWVPLTWQAFQDYMQGNVQLSADEAALLSLIIEYERSGSLDKLNRACKEKNITLGRSEEKEFKDKLTLLGISV